MQKDEGEEQRIGKTIIKNKKKASSLADWVVGCFLQKVRDLCTTTNTSMIIARPTGRNRITVFSYFCTSILGTADMQRIPFSKRFRDAELPSS